MDLLLSISPVIITMFVAAITHKTLLSIFSGLSFGILILSKFSVSDFFFNLYYYFIHIFTDIIRLKIVFFILCIGIFLYILNQTKAYNSFAIYSLKKINTPRKTRLYAFLMSFCLFFDDYANVLITGTTFKNIFEKNKISTYKLAYIIDTVSCVCSIALISTWAYYEISIIKESLSMYKVAENATIFFIKSIIFNFYTITAILICLTYCITGYWLGFQRIKHNTNFKIDFNSNTKPYIMILPISTWILSSIVLVFIFGYIYSDYSNSIINILGASPILEILIFSTIIATFLLISLCIKDKIFKSYKIYFVFAIKGIKSIFSVAIILLLANGFSKMSLDLNTGYQLSQLFIKLNFYNQFLPLFIFFLSVIISITTGSSWSTMAIIMPIAFQLIFIENISSYNYIVIASVISGSLAGAKLVPYSDKVILSSLACEISSFLHIKTQFPYVILSILITVLSYINFILFENIYFVYIMVLILIFIIFKIISYQFKKL